jgi:hypothetical protein
MKICSCCDTRYMDKFERCPRCNSRGIKHGGGRACRNCGEFNPDSMDNCFRCNASLK